MRLIGEPADKEGPDSIEEKLKKLGLESQPASEGEDDMYYEESDSESDSSESSDVWDDPD